MITLQTTNGPSQKMAESCKVTVVVALLVLTARVLSCTHYWNRTELRKDLPEDVPFVPELEVSLSAALLLPSAAPSLPRRVVLCSQDKRHPTRAIVRVNGWLLLLMLYGDVEANPGLVSKFSCSRCEKAVQWNQKGVQCDDCAKWHHTSCNMPAFEYLSLSESNVSWLCPACSPSAATSTALGPDKSASVGSASPVPTLPSHGATAWSSNFSIVHLNVRSLLGHFDQILEFVNSYSPDIVALSETWLDPSVGDLLIAIPGFRIYRSDRHLHGGGVCVCIICQLLTQMCQV